MPGSKGFDVADRELEGSVPETGARGVKGLLAATVALLLAGGILLDMNRINSVRDSLDRVAYVAAFEAAAATRPAERQNICQKRFAKTVWTDSEVSMDDIDVSVTQSGRGNTALVTYDATVQLVVGRFFGFNEVVISGEAEVTAPGKQVAAATP
jgi:uncharacterized membrane protein